MQKSQGQDSPDKRKMGNKDGTKGVNKLENPAPKIYGLDVEEFNAPYKFKCISLFDASFTGNNISLVSSSSKLNVTHTSKSDPAIALIPLILLNNDDSLSLLFFAIISNVSVVSKSF